jgi:hypothetical protein
VRRVAVARDTQQPLGSRGLFFGYRSWTWTFLPDRANFCD